MVMAIGVRELHRLGHDVNVGRRIVPHRLQVEALEDVQCHGQHGALGPRPARVELDAVEARAHRGLELHAESREVLVAHRPAFFLDEFRHDTRDVALVERGARRAEPGLAAPPARDLFLLVRHVLQRAAEIGLDENLAHFRRAALWQEDFAACRPAAERLLVLLDEIRHHRMHREALARETDGAGGDFSEAHGSKGLERGEPRIGRRRHDAALDALRDLAAVPADEVIRRDRARPDAQPVDAVHLPALRGVDELGRHAAEVDLVGLQHADRNSGGNPGIDRIAARLEDLEPGVRGKVVPGRDDVPGAHDGGAAGSHAGALVRGGMPIRHCIHNPRGS